MFTKFRTPTPEPEAMVLKVLLVLLSVFAPVPSKAKPWPLLVMAPLRVRAPAPLKRVALVRLTEPDKLLVPVEAVKVPPLKVNASAPTVTPRKSSVAPLATVVPPEVAPKPDAWLMAKVPAETVVAPL